MKKLSSFLGIGFVLMVGAIAGGIGKQAGKALFEPSKPTSQQIEQKIIEGFGIAANKLNQSAPTMVDEDTRMDKATVGPGPRLTYHYTFLRYSSREISSSWLQANLRPVVKNNVYNSNDMKRSIQYGGIYSYSYSANDGIQITNFEFNRNDCGLPKITP